MIPIKEMTWIVEHYPQAREIATHFYSGQYKDHEYLNLPDESYLRFPMTEERRKTNLPALTGEEAFKLLPAYIERGGKRYYKILEETDLGALVLKYGQDFPPVIKGVGLITLGKDLGNLCFDMMTRLEETGLHK